MRFILPLVACLALAACPTVDASENAPTTGLIRVAVDTDGQLQGSLYTVMGEDKTPLVGKISLTNADGNTISTSRSDKTGKFVFTDVTPGTYKAIGVAGDYVGEAQIEVFTVKVDDAKEDKADESGFYTALPLAVAPIQDVALNSFSALPVGALSAAPVVSGGCSTCSAAPAPVVGGCSTCGGCNTCGGSAGGFGGGSAGGGFGGGGGLLRGAGGGFNFRRLALLGGAVAIPVALSGGDDDAASPAN